MITMYEVWTRDPEVDDCHDTIQGRFLDATEAFAYFDGQVEAASIMLCDNLNLNQEDLVEKDSEETFNTIADEDPIPAGTVKVLKATDICVKDGIDEASQFIVVLLRKEYKFGKFPE